MLNLAITIPSKWDEFGGVSPLAEVRLQEGESLENALRRFKRKVQQEDIIKEVKRHSFYLKPGEKKRLRKHWRESEAVRKREKNKNKKVGRNLVAAHAFNSSEAANHPPIVRTFPSAEGPNPGAAKIRGREQGLS